MSDEASRPYFLKLGHSADLPDVTFISAAIPSRERGVSRSSRTLGAGCGGRGGVRRAKARGRMTHSRTAKSCGPGAPTLVSSLQGDLQATVARKPGHRGEHEGNR